MTTTQDPPQLEHLLSHEARRHRDEAFALLVMVGERTSWRLVDVAAQVEQTGRLPF